MAFLRRHRILVVLLGLGVLVTVLVGFTLILIPTLYVMFEEQFPRTIASIEDDGAPPRREVHAQ